MASASSASSASSANSKQSVGSRVISPYTLMKGFVTIQEEKELRKKDTTINQSKNIKVSKDTKVS